MIPQVFTNFQILDFSSPKRKMQRFWLKKTYMYVVLKIKQTRKQCLYYCLQTTDVISIASKPLLTSI